MNVLLLSDFSEVAINATHYAMDLLQDQEVKFHLLNIFDPEPELGDQSAEDKKVSTLAHLEERVKKLQKRSENELHKITGHYSEDKLINAARDFVGRQKIDLIVMGAVGQKQRKSSILGKHTFEIISKIKCNILAVPDDAKFQKPKKLLMPLDSHNTFFGMRNIRFLNNPDLFKEANLSIWEITESGLRENEGHARNKEVFSGLENLKMKFSSINAAAIFDKKIWVDVQNKFSLIVLLGKNIRICDGLLHNKYGLYATMPNSLPILVLHD